MNYASSCQFFNTLSMSHINLGLLRVKKVSAFLGNPHLSFKTIHIAGTNGKGSVAMMLYELLAKHGFNVGLYTSPHLIDVRERIFYNGQMIDEISFARYMTKIKNTAEKLEISLTYFEYLTLIAFLFFKEKKVDYAVVEVGLGGRLDATNIIKDKIAVITGISYDHQDYLGQTLKEIAKEKFGIIYKNNLIVTGITQLELLKDLKKKCLAQKATLKIFKQAQTCKNIRQCKQGYIFDCLNFKKILIPSIAKYQIQNAGLALTVAQQIINLDEQKVKAAFKDFFWPGRMENIKLKNKKIILEGAHNPEGIEKLAEHLKTMKEPFLLVLGIIKTKDYKAMIKKIAPLASMIIVNSSFYKEKAVPADVLQKECLLYCKDVKIIEELEDIGEFILKYKFASRVYVAGSLYLVGKIRKVIRGV